MEALRDRLPGGKQSLVHAAMNSLALAHPKIRRVAFSRQALFIGLAICAVWVFFVTMHIDISERWSNPRVDYDSGGPDTRPQPKRLPQHNVLPQMADRIPCFGPRGKLLGKSPDDDLVESEFDDRTQLALFLGTPRSRLVLAPGLSLLTSGVVQATPCRSLVPLRLLDST